MIPSKYLWVLAILLLIGLSFYSVEAFINSNTTSMITLTRDVPISRIVLECVREPKGDAWINLADLNIVDENENRVAYWSAPNSVHMANGDLGYEHMHWPIQNLYDGNIDTCAHSSTAPDKLTIELSPPIKLSSVQITNRKDGAAERIQKYDMKLYNQTEVVGSKPLTNLGENGKSITYLIMKPSMGPQGPQGIQGQTGMPGMKGDKGDTGPMGLQGNVGPVGAEGPQGVVGPQGPQGPRGIQGINGARGEVGAIGLEGVAGGTCAH